MRMEIIYLATSAGINLGLAILFFTLYSVFRKQHANAGVYFTRHLLRERQRMKLTGEEKETFSLENLVPSATWVKRALDPSEEDILKSSGVDAVVFLRVFIFWCVMVRIIPYFVKILKPSGQIFNQIFF